MKQKGKTDRQNKINIRDQRQTDKQDKKKDKHDDERKTTLKRQQKTEKRQ
jgi:hypothetical protein